MALRSKKNTTKAAKETTKKVVVEEAEVIEDAAEVVEEQDAPETKEVVVKKKGNVPATTGTPVNVIKDYENALPPVEFGTLPRIKASNGEFLDDENNSLGKEFEFTLISFNDNWAITPNVNDVSANKFCRFSYDGNELNDGSGTTVEEWMDELRGEGFENPSKKKYIEVVCILDDAEDDNENIGEMVQLSLSPQSVKKFDAYKLQCMVKMAKGMITAEDASKITAKARNKTFGTNTFTVFTFK